MRRPVVTLVLAALAGLALAAPSAQAHAMLEGTSPARGAVLTTQPKAVVFRFGESVEGNFGAVRVFDAKGQRVDDNKVVHPGGRGSAVAVGLRPHLKDGTYTATYRVISADSHPVSGGVVFTIGHAGAGSAETVADLLAGSNVGAVTETAFGITRGLDYLAIALGVGGLAFLLAAWRPALAFAAGAGAGWPQASAVFAARARRLLWLAVGMGVVSGAAGIVLQGATASGTSFWSALDTSVVREVLGTRFGTIWGLRIIAWLLLGGVLMAGASTRAVAVLRPAAVGAAGVAPAPAPTRAQLAALALPAAFLLVSPALAGHATTLHPVAALLPLDVVHVTAMSVWVGGLAMLLFVLPGATRRLESPERSRLLAAVLVRFSPMALACVAALLATGVTQALVDMGGLSPLLNTAFGRAVLIKFVLLMALIGLGAVNRQRVVPALRRLAAGGEAPGGAGRVLRQHPARGGRARRRGAGRDLGARQLRAAEVGGQRPVLGHQADGSDRAADHDRSGAHRRQPASRLPLRRAQRRSVHQDQGADCAGLAPLQGDRPAAGDDEQGRPRPLRRQHLAARARRRLEAGRHRSRL